jgi:hypothetical protein
MFRIATPIFVTFLCAAAALPGADTSWTKVKDLKSHAELRIWKKGAREPINATFDDANEERIMVVVKNEQIAFPKDDIDRIDARPGGGPRKATVEKTEKQSDPDYTPGRPGSGPPLPQTSSQSNVSFGNKPDFETIYRRAEGAPKK